MLTGQVAVSAAAGGGGALDCTGVQLAGVLDDLFATGARPRVDAGDFPLSTWLRPLAAMPAH
jgi:hypothetical protein